MRGRDDSVRAKKKIGRGKWRRCQRCRKYKDERWPGAPGLCAVCLS